MTRTDWPSKRQPPASLRAVFFGMGLFEHPFAQAARMARMNSTVLIEGRKPWFARTTHAVSRTLATTPGLDKIYKPAAFPSSRDHRRIMRWLCAPGATDKPACHAIRLIALSH